MTEHDSWKETIMRTSETEIRELGHRQNDGLDITLFWNSESGEVFVVVEDQRDGKAFKLDVDAAHALDAFRHPFAYVRDDGYAEALAA